MKLQIEIFKHTEKKEINKWLAEHEHQLLDQRGTHVMENAIIFVYDSERIKIEAPKEIVATGPQTKPEDIEKARKGQAAAGLIQMLRNQRASVVESRIKNELAMREVGRMSFGKKGGVDPSKIAEVKTVIHNNKVSLEEIDKLIKDLEEGKLEDILATDPNSSIITNH